MISQTGWWTQTPFATSLQPKTWNAHLWITFNFWWLAGLVDGLKPHLPPLSSQKHEMLIFVLHLISDVGQTCQWTRTPSTIPLQPKTWNAHFCITFNFWWLVGLVDGLKPHSPPLSSQKIEMLIFGLHSLWMIGQAGQWTQNPSATPLQPKKWNAHFWITFTLDDRPGWSMDSNPIHHSSPANKMKCSFLDYIQLLMISQAGQWNRTPSASPLQPKKMKCYFLDYIQLLMIGRAGQWTQISSSTSLQPKKRNAHFWITFNFWWSAGLVNGLEPHPPPVSCQKIEIFIFVLCWTSDDQPGWCMDSNPICHPSPAKKMKCSFLDFVQLLMISQAGQWTQTPSATPLLPKKWNAHFWIAFTSDDWLG